MRVILPGVPTIAQREIRVIIEQLCESLFKKVAIAKTDSKSIRLKTCFTFHEDSFIELTSNSLLLIKSVMHKPTTSNIGAIIVVRTTKKNDFYKKKLIIIQTSQFDINSSFSFSDISEIGEKLVIIDEESEIIIKKRENKIKK